ncbi:hypothetical protein D3C75_549430 [compost metagenome]
MVPPVNVRASDRAELQQGVLCPFQAGSDKDDRPLRKRIKKSVSVQSTSDRSA